MWVGEFSACQTRPVDFSVCMLSYAKYFAQKWPVEIPLKLLSMLQWINNRKEDAEENKRMSNYSSKKGGAVYGCCCVSSKTVQIDMGIINRQ